MATPKNVPRPKRSLALKIVWIITTIFLVIYLTFLAVGITSGNLGASLLVTPAVIFGLLAMLLLIFWPGRWGHRFKVGALSGLLVLFAITGYYSFHILFKFIQPTVLPKKVVPDGNPWVIEGNVVTQNNYNNAVVIKLDDGTYRMYLHDSDKMLSAASSDGKKFGEFTELFQGEMPTIIKLDDGRWRMYYFVNAGQNAPQPQMQPQQPQPMPNGGDMPAPKHELVSAVSSDGVQWTREDGVRLTSTPGSYDAGTMIHPSVIRLNDGTYKLYYDGEVPDTHSYALVIKFRKILSASSKDGLIWTKDPGYRIDETPVHSWEAYSPKAMYKDGKVIIHFTTPNGIYVATSTDTLNFKVSDNPVFSPGRVPMPDGNNGVTGSYQDAFVLPVEGGNRIYFWISGKGIYSAFQKN